jgi:hypothetical protein
MTLPKLADYRNDLFASHNNMGDALCYVNDMCSAAPSADASIAMRTIAHIILNTAITMHKDEIAAIVLSHAEANHKRNDPLTEQIKAIVREVTRHELAEKMPDMMTECIEEWVGDNLDKRIEDWAEQNIDLADAVETHMNNEVDWDDVVGDKVNDKIRSYFRNNSFTIEEN